MFCARFFSSLHQQSLCQRRFIAFHCDKAPLAHNVFVHRTFAPRATFFALLSLMLALNGCALFQTPPPTTSSTRNANGNVATSVSAKPNAKNPERSLFATWFDALTQKPAATPQPTVIAASPVFIDINVLAQRFPAWKLAAQLDGATGSKTSISVPPGFGRNLNRARFSVSSSPAGNRVLDQVLDIVNSSDDFGFLQTVSMAATRQTSDETSLQDAAQSRISGGLTQFLRDAARVQNASRQAQENEARATLEDEVAASRDIALPPLQPIGLPSAVQLEITNLRLKLLTNSNTPLLERENARARLFKLQEIWREKLRAQEQQLLDEWNRQRDEEPLRVRREGEAQIAVQTEREQRLDRARLVALQDEQARFLANDFGSGDFTARDALSVALPSFDFYQFRDISTTKRASSNANSWFRLPRFESVVAPPLFSSLNKTSTRRENGARATQLRLQALRDASVWARNLARRRNWSLAERPIVGVRDETQSAVQTLGFH